jgi:capsular polysaccharide export protein
VFLFPLQLDSDVQIRVHSRFSGMKSAIPHVLDLFARCAGPDAVLVIKNHPLDNGMINYRRLIADRASVLGIGQRVVFIDGGDLGKLLDLSAGVITINSTVGLTALERNIPVLVLGRSIYAIPGVAETEENGAFWAHPPRPDRKLFDTFRSALFHHCHVNGNFYTKKGILLSVENSKSRLLNSPGIR